MGDWRTPIFAVLAPFNIGANVQLYQVKNQGIYFPNMLLFRHLLDISLRWAKCDMLI